MAIGDSNWGNVVLACRFDGEGFVDKSPSRNVLTPSGSASISTTQSKYGGASLSLTSGSVLISSPDFDFGTADFAVAFWLYQTSTAGQIISFRYGFGINEYYFKVESASGKIGVGSSSATQESPAAAVPASSWTYVTASRRGGNAYFSVAGTVYGPYNLFISGAASLLTCGIRLGESGLFAGSIEDLVIYKGIDPFTANFTHPSAPVPFYYAQVSGTTKDKDGNFARRLVRAIQCADGKIAGETLSHPTTGEYAIGCHNNKTHCVIGHDADAWITYLPFDGANNATVFPEWSGKTVTPFGNAKISTAQSYFGGSSLYLDGTGDYLTIPASPDLNFGTGDFSIKLEVRLDSLGVERAIIDTRDVETDKGLYLSITAANQLSVFTNNTTIATGTTALSATTFHNVELVRSSGVMTLYLNGTSVGSGASTHLVTAKTKLVIGRKLGSTSNDFAGYIDDLVIRKGVADHTANFTRPAVSYADSRPDGAKNAVLLDLLTPV